MNAVKAISTRYIVWLCFMLFPGASVAADYDGSLMWSKRAELGTAISGVVAEVMVQQGDIVNKGSELLKLDGAILKSRVREYKALLNSATEIYKEAERERDRAIELYDRTVLSDHDLQVAKNDFVKAKAELENVRTLLVTSQYELKYSVVRAPFDAIVLERNVQPGQIIATALKPQPLVVVAEANVMLARVMVPQLNQTTFAKGRQASVLVDGQRYTAKIQAVHLEPEQNGRGYYVDVRFETKGKQLHVGQPAKVTIE